MKLELYTPNNIDNISVVNSAYFKYICSLLQQNDFISNLHGNSYILSIDDKYFLPIFVGEFSIDNTYLVSLYSHYILYAKEELCELKNPPMEFLCKKILDFTGFFLRYCQMDQVVYVNNLLVSTNLYPDFPFDEKINDFLASKFPKKTICWNSINPVTTPDLYDKMRNAGMTFLPARSVYINKTFPPKLSRDLKRDVNLREKSNFVIKKIDDSNFDKARIKELYDDLYIRKYSKFNPMYTTNFIETTYNQGFLNFYGVFDCDKMIGVVGFYVVDGIMASPILGIDSSVNRNLGVYRLLMLELYEQAKNNGYVHHASSGASSFKRSRHAENTFEYRVLHFSKTTSIFQKSALNFIRIIEDKIAVPMMKKRGL